MHHPVSRVGHELHYPRLPGLEAHGGSGGDIEPEATRLLPIEAEGVVGFIEVVMRADLDRPVAGVRYLERDRRTADIQLDVAGARYHFTWDHGASLSDRLVDGDELGAIGKRRLDLDLLHHLRHALHHLRAREHRGTVAHELRD